MDRTESDAHGPDRAGPLTRRGFLRLATLAGLTVGGSLLAACGGQAPAAPTTAPAKPTEAPKPAAPPAPSPAASPAAAAPAAAAPAVAKPGGPAEIKIGAIYPLTGGSVAQGE